MAHIPEVPLPHERIARLRQLVAREIQRIVEDLETRREFLVDVWSRHRDRGPFLDTAHSRFGALGFADLVNFEPELVSVLEGFYRELDEFRLYISYTQDMPITLLDRYDWVLRRLQRWGELAIEALGGLPERMEIVVDDTRPVGPVPKGLVNLAPPEPPPRPVLVAEGPSLVVFEEPAPDAEIPDRNAFKTLPAPAPPLDEDPLV